MRPQPHVTVEEAKGPYLDVTVRSLPPGVRDVTPGRSPVSVATASLRAHGDSRAAGSCECSGCQSGANAHTQPSRPVLGPGADANDARAASKVTRSRKLVSAPSSLEEQGVRPRLTPARTDRFDRRAGTIGSRHTQQLPGERIPLGIEIELDYAIERWELFEGIPRLIPPVVFCLPRVAEWRTATVDPVGDWELWGALVTAAGQALDDRIAGSPGWPPGWAATPSDQWAVGLDAFRRWIPEFTSAFNRLAMQRINDEPSGRALLEFDRMSGLGVDPRTCFLNATTAQVKVMLTRGECLDERMPASWSPPPDEPDIAGFCRSSPMNFTEGTHWPYFVMPGPGLNTEAWASTIPLTCTFPLYAPCGEEPEPPEELPETECDATRAYQQLPIAVTQPQWDALAGSAAYATGVYPLVWTPPDTAGYSDEVAYARDREAAWYEMYRMAVSSWLNAERTPFPMFYPQVLQAFADSTRGGHVLYGEIDRTSDPAPHWVMLKKCVPPNTDEPGVMIDYTEETRPPVFEECGSPPIYTQRDVTRDQLRTLQMAWDAASAAVPRLPSLSSVSLFTGPAVPVNTRNALWMDRFVEFASMDLSIPPELIESVGAATWGVTRLVVVGTDKRIGVEQAGVNLAQVAGSIKVWALECP